MKLSIQGTPIQSIYASYSDGQYIINRRYQRKLVWGIEEKSKFIDSILKEFPVPMILAANYGNGFEILDGMQRLNAITSFIEGEFHVDGQYFNTEELSHMSSIKEKRAKGEITERSSLLSPEKCSTFLNYQVPFSIFMEGSPEKLDEIFRRINTGGRTLSKQDVRQAGAVGLIPEIINKAAIYIRKDSSHSDIVDLRNIRNISLSNRGLNYGINIFDIFWAKHGIITFENIRMSRDEELVAHLISYIAAENSGTSSYYLNKIYDSSSDECIDLTRSIQKIGFDSILTRFKHTFNELEKTLDSHPDKKNFKEIIYQGTPIKVTQAYQVIFIAFYKALVLQEKKIINHKNLCAALNGLFERTMQVMDNDRKWTPQDRNELSDAVLGVIQAHFKSHANNIPSFNTWVAHLENILNQSKTEQVCYDFKIGFYEIGAENTSQLQNSVNKIAKTLVAMTNTKPGECYVIVGVADKPEDAEKYTTHYVTDSINYNGFDILGVNAEASKFHSSLSGLEQTLVQRIGNAPISGNFKLMIKQNITSLNYREKHIIIFKATRGAEPELYEGKWFARELSHINEITSTTFIKFLAEFNNGSNRPLN